MARKRRRKGKGAKAGNRARPYEGKPPALRPGAGAPGPAVDVRCLGPGPEHRFSSPDPSRVRVCDRCRARLDGVRLGLREEYNPVGRPRDHRRPGRSEEQE